MGLEEDSPMSCADEASRMSRRRGGGVSSDARNVDAAARPNSEGDEGRIMADKCIIQGGSENSSIDPRRERSRTAWDELAHRKAFGGSRGSGGEFGLAERD